MNEVALELAEELHRAIPCAEKIRYAASGTEATFYCLRFAKAYTGRPKVLKFEGAYHGAHDIGVISLFPKKLYPFPAPEPTSAGVSKRVQGEVLIAPYNDLETTRKIIDQHGNEIACVIMEPLQRCTPPEKGFLEGIRKVTKEHGILLVFDEVVTGFRLAYGGAQEYYGVVPDLAAFGKAMGGGYPIAAICGKADIVDLCTEDRMGEERYIWFASTLAGNPVSASASLATLRNSENLGLTNGFMVSGNSCGRDLEIFFTNSASPDRCWVMAPSARFCLQMSPFETTARPSRLTVKRGGSLCWNSSRMEFFLIPWVQNYISLWPIRMKIFRRCLISAGRPLKKWFEDAWSHILLPFRS